MAVPSTREAFKNYCLRRLGEPVIDVNVDDEQDIHKLAEVIGLKVVKNGGKGQVN